MKAHTHALDEPGLIVEMHLREHMTEVHGRTPDGSYADLYRWHGMEHPELFGDPECCDHADVTNGICDDCGEQVGPIVVTLGLSGLPAECPHCGAPAPDGQWGIGVHGNLLHLICPRCFIAVAPVRAVAAGPQGHYHDATGHEDTLRQCPSPGTYAPQWPQTSSEEG